MTQLRAGSAKVDITPTNPCWQAGYDSRMTNNTMSTGVYDRLYARALVVEGEGGAAAIVSCDLCFLDPETINEVRGLVCAPLGMAPENVMVLTTHTHSGPVANVRPRRDSPPRTDLEWLAGTVHRLAEAILLAQARLAPATMSVARGTSRVGMNRRMSLPDGSIELGAAPEKPIDPEMIAVLFDSVAGKPLARLVNYGCHGTALGPGNLLISADYMGRAMTAVEATLGGEAICVFANGGSGNIDPYYRVLPNAADPRVQEVADKFTQDVLRTLAGPAAPVSGARVAGMFRDLDLPRKVAGFEAGLGRNKRIRAQAVRLGDLVIAGSPNEIVCEIVMAIKARSLLANTLMCSYCYNAAGPWHGSLDGPGGYLPAAAHYEEGGYEVRTSPFGPEAEAVYTRGMLELIAQVGGKGGMQRSV